MTAQALPVAEEPALAHGWMATGRPLAPFRHRDFRVLLLSTMALQIGSWVQMIGQGWLVKHDLHGSATDLATIALLRGASLVLLSPVGGYLAGRFERRRQLVVYTLGSALIATLLAILVATGRIEIWMVYGTAMLAGIVEAMAGPIRSLLVFDSVTADELTGAVALNALAGNAMRVIGPAIGGVLIGVVGTQGTFQLQAACLVAAALLTWQLRPHHPERTPGMGMWQSIGGGLSYVARDRRMLLIVYMAVLPSVLVYPYVTFLPVFATDVLQSNETGYGYLAAAVGVGSLLGGAVVAITTGKGRMGPGMMWSCLCYCLSVACFALAWNLWLAVGILCIAGVFHSVYSALNASLMQIKADPEFRSRVVSLQTMTWGLTPFAGLVMGKMIDLWAAPHVVFGWMAVATLLTAVTLASSKEMRRI